MTAFLQEDEAEVFKDARKRLYDPCGGMGVIVAMDGDYRAMDYPPKLQKLAAASKLLGLSPDTLEDIVLAFQYLIVVGQGVVRVSFG